MAAKKFLRSKTVHLATGAGTAIAGYNVLQALPVRDRYSSPLVMFGLGVATIVLSPNDETGIVRWVGTGLVCGSTYYTATLMDSGRFAGNFGTARVRLKSEGSSEFIEVPPAAHTLESLTGFKMDSLRIDGLAMENVPGCIFKVPDGVEVYIDHDNQVKFTGVVDGLISKYIARGGWYEASQFVANNPNWAGLAF